MANTLVIAKVVYVAVLVLPLSHTNRARGMLSNEMVDLFSTSTVSN